MKKETPLGRRPSVKAKDAKRSRTVSLSDNQVKVLKGRYKSLTNALNSLIEQIENEGQEIDF